MPPNAPKVSLIVCTRNRGPRLLDFLSRLLDLEPPAGGWELILVDNASTDATPRIIEEFARSAPMPVRYVRAPGIGLARARNAGLAIASGEVLAFTDDDCYPQPDYLRATVTVFEEHRVGFIGGRVVLYDPTDAAVCEQDLATPMEIGPRAFIMPGSIHGANMAVTREVVRAIGGFDPHLGAGTPCVAGEDAEYLARASWAGWRGRYDPRPVVAHHHGRKPGLDAVRQSRGYDYGRGAYYIRLVLNPRARSTYLGHWFRLARQRRARKHGRPWRELVGAARYLVSRVMRPESVPRFNQEKKPLGAHQAPSGTRL